MPPYPRPRRARPAGGGPRVAPGTPKKADDVARASPTMTGDVADDDARRSDDDGRVAPKAADDPARVTPMMAQYLEIKAANPDCLLFYRMGDFYELFFDDAEVASRALGIVLTKRGRHNGEDIRMCGVPVERADDYLQRLIGLGHRVAVCEQTEDPAEAKKRGAKSVVRRDVVRHRHAGHDHRGQAARRRARRTSSSRSRAARPRTRAGPTALRRSTSRPGASRCRRPTPPGSRPRSPGSEPREIVVPDQILDDPELRNLWRETRAAVTPIARDGLDPAAAERRLRGFLRRRDARQLRRLLARRDRPRPGRRCITSSAPSSGSGRRSSRRVARRRPASSRSMPRRAPISSSPGRSPASAPAASLATIDRTVSPSGARLLAERARRPSDRPRRDSRAPGRGRVPRRGGGAARAPARRPARRAGHRPGAVAAWRSSAAARATSPACATA